MADLPTGTVTFLFSDIEGSTRLLQRLGPDYARVRGEHQTLLRQAWGAHGGVEVDTAGDSFFVAFPTAPAAVAAAAEATRALAAHPWPEDAPLRVRIGLHTGTPRVTAGGYVGLDVHRAARIAAAGHGGQVLLSAATRGLVEHDLPDGTTLRALGAFRLKDLQHAEHLCQLVLPGLPADFPPLKTLDLRPHNLPLQPTPLLGREEQVATLSALLRGDGGRLVTLTGPGGIGKTRLAVQVAAELVDAFADGVWFVHLSRLTDPEMVVPTIAQTLGLKESGGTPLTDLLQAYVAERHLLLVLDNFEQVVEAAPDLASLLGHSPGLRLLVTSRVTMRLRGEHEYALSPLALPDPQHLPPPERLSQYAAVALFIERAQAARHDFTVTSANAPAIAEICARLDGLPLAIELAASRVRVLLPEALLARLATQLTLLTGGPRDAEERQQTMRNTLAWSYDLLKPEERRLFRRLAVFAGGCTLEAAEAICAAPAGAVPLGLDVLEGLSRLVDHSLVQQREEDGEARFGMLQVIREYARERLEASSEQVNEAGSEGEALRRAHAAYYLAMAERAEPELIGPEQGAWLRRLEDELDNLRAALGWARERGERGAATEVETGLRLVAALSRFWHVRGHLREAQAWVEALMALAGPVTADAVDPVSASVRARALLTRGLLALLQGDRTAAEPWQEQAAALAQAAGDRRTTAYALISLGRLAWDQSDWERAASRFEASLTLFRQLGDRRGTGIALNSLALILLRQGELERAAANLAESLALARQVGDPRSIANALFNLGHVEWRRGEMAQAEALGQEALALSRDLGDLSLCIGGLEHLAMVGVAEQAERATRLLGAAAAVRETIGEPESPPNQEDNEEVMAQARRALGRNAGRRRSRRAGRSRWRRPSPRRWAKVKHRA
jgi:predicted ATPase/class 3 adenylate cyclase